MINPLKLLREYKAASALNAALEDGAAHPELYRSEPFWTRVVLAAIALVNQLPLPKGTNIMSQFWHKLAMITGVIVALAPQVQAVQQVIPLPAAATSIIGLVFAVAGALYHNVPGQPALPAGPQSIGAK